ncbi:MAG: sigma-70 family RNA polymerase sigma factor [Lachnospiraceae bacterium]|nr:sigma-70 family RNA polymerase sigma factor [Lachnospiraceae bacterium]CDA68676.1 rNA polymerase sigma factor sigma-70 family [Clostridium sp. CAG:510]
MDDKKIIDLYWKRSESAIAETDKKYGRYCSTIAFNILHNREDAEECVNDTYFKVWGVIPTLRPLKFSAFIGRITRNLSLNKYEYYNAKKRGQGETQVVFEELQGCIASTGNVEDAIEDMLLSEKLNCFLEGLPTEKRKIFMRRYWYLSGVKDIASDYQMSESKVKMILLRTRNALKEYLEQEGIVL